MVLSDAFGNIEAGYIFRSRNEEEEDESLGIYLESVSHLVVISELRNVHIIYHEIFIPSQISLVDIYETRSRKDSSELAVFFFFFFFGNISGVCITINKHIKIKAKRDKSFR